MEYVVETNALVKKYGQKAAVDNMSVHVRKGDIYGLIGKNGAGKTSLMKLLLGLTIPNSGEIKLFGSTDLGAARMRIGSLIEAPAIYKNETAMENLARFSLLAPTSKNRMHELLELVGLGDVGKKKAGAFSLGMRQRLGIAIALLGDPELLILDEPINGLDPAGIKEIRDLIVEMNRRGTTFMISSHLLDELGKIATNYGIAHEGVLEEITAEELQRKCRVSLKLGVSDPAKAQELIRASFPELQTHIEGGKLHILSDVNDPAALNRALVMADIGVYELAGEGTGMEDFFIERLGR
ncbi:MAG: ATP-binding cassette domain-containing protein [Clostridia bacterium]|nr:ATP-binding cassette domain-containing protein [Clostridia bacterium]